MLLIVCRLEMARLEAHRLQKEVQHKMLKEYVDGNMSIWHYNIKMDFKESIFEFTLNSSTISQVK